MAAKKEPPIVQDAKSIKRFGELSDGDLADEYGKHQALVAEAKEPLDLIKNEFKRRRRTRFVGTFFEVVVRRTTRTTFGARFKDAVTKKLGKAFVARYADKSTSTVVRCNARKIDPISKKRAA